LLTGENEDDIERMILEQCQSQESLFDMIVQKPITIERLGEILRHFGIK